MQTFKIFYDDGEQKYKSASNLKILMYWLMRYDEEVNNITKIERIVDDKAKKLNGYERIK